MKNGRKRGLASLGVFLSLGCLACQPAPLDPEAPLEVEDVSLPPDALVDPELDEKEVRAVGSGLSGQLPSSFPVDFPSYPGASVTDLGESENWVEFLVADGAAAVASKYAAQLRRAGWQLGTLSTDGEPQWVAGGSQQVSISLEPKGPSTRIVIRY